MLLPLYISQLPVVGGEIEVFDFCSGCEYEWSREFTVQLKILTSKLSVGTIYYSLCRTFYSVSILKNVLNTSYGVRQWWLAENFTDSDLVLESIEKFDGSFFSICETLSWYGETLNLAELLSLPITLLKRSKKRQLLSLCYRRGSRPDNEVYDYA